MLPTMIYIGARNGKAPSASRTASWAIAVTPFAKILRAWSGWPTTSYSKSACPGNVARSECHSPHTGLGLGYNTDSHDFIPSYRLEAILAGRPRDRYWAASNRSNDSNAATFDRSHSAPKQAKLFVPRSYRLG